MMMLMFIVDDDDIDFLYYFLFSFGSVVSNARFCTCSKGNIKQYMIRSTQNKEMKTKQDFGVVILRAMCTNMSAVLVLVPVVLSSLIVHDLV
jgi:hypothetical protein